MVKNRKRTVDDSEPAPKVAKIARKVVQLLPIPTRPTRTATVLSCGQNDVGQLGLGEDVPEKTRPALIPGATDAVDISAGGMHSLYLNNKGEVYSFGCNDEGALGRDTSEEGSEYELGKVDLPDSVVRISTGDSHSACLLEDGRVLAWGSFRDSHGNMGLTVEGNKRLPVEVFRDHKFVDIASGADHLAMLSTDGKLFTVGCAEQGQLGRVSARSSSGQTRRGKSELLQPGQVYSKQHFNAIWATTYCTFAKTSDTNAIYAFGLNNYEQLAVEKHEDSFFTPRLTTFADVQYISGGQHHTLMLANDGTCQVIGRLDYGRLGVGKVDKDLTKITHIKSLDGLDVIQVACGESCSFARTKDGKVYAWGIGSNNQLGTGSDEDVYEPVLLTGAQVKGKEVLNVNSGGQHTLFLVSNIEAAAPVAADHSPVPAKIDPKQTAVAPAAVNGTTADKAEKEINGKAKAGKLTTKKGGAKRK